MNRVHIVITGPAALADHVADDIKAAFALRRLMRQAPLDAVLVIERPRLVPAPIPGPRSDRLTPRRFPGSRGHV